MSNYWRQPKCFPALKTETIVQMSDAFNKLNTARMVVEFYDVPLGMFEIWLSRMTTVPDPEVFELGFRRLFEQEFVNLATIRLEELRRYKQARYLMRSMNKQERRIFRKTYKHTILTDMAREGHTKEHEIREKIKLIQEKTVQI